MPRLAPHLLPSKDKKSKYEALSESSKSSFRLSKEITAKVDSWRTKPIKPRIKNDMLKEVNNILTMGEINKNLKSSKRYLRTVRNALSKSIETASEEDIKDDDLSQSKVRNLMSFWNTKLTHRPITVSYDYTSKNPKKYRPLSKDGVQEEHTLKPSQIKETHINLKKSTSHETIKKNPIREIRGIRKKIIERNQISFEKFSEIESISNKNKWMNKYLKNIYEVRKFKGLDPSRIFLVEILKQKYLESMKYPYIYFISNISQNVETSYLKSIEPPDQLEENDSDEYKMSVETISFITGIGTDFLVRLLEIMDRGDRTAENLCSISRSDLDKLCQIKNELPVEKNVLNYVESVEDLFLDMGDTCKKKCFDVLLRFAVETALRLKDEFFLRKKTYIFLTSSLIFCIFMFVIYS